MKVEIKRPASGILSNYKYQKLIARFPGFSVFLLLMIFSVQTMAQDWGWWNEIHDWNDSKGPWKRMLIISPGYFGPNALPVPEMKKGINAQESDISISASRHFSPGDNTQDISGKLYVPFANGKIAFEAYGVILENYNFSEEIRDERISRDYDGRGIAQGDLYVSTSIQVSRDRRFPNTLFRFVARTASGGGYGAARFTDNPGYYFDFSFGKDYAIRRVNNLKLFASGGFYSWQTNDGNNLQNDALLYGIGADFKAGNWLMTGSFSGYTGYHKNRDKPQIISAQIRHDWDLSAVSLDYYHGLRDWMYQTVKFTYVWKFRGQ